MERHASGLGAVRRDTTGMKVVLVVEACWSSSSSSRSRKEGKSGTCDAKVASEKRSAVKAKGVSVVTASGGSWVGGSVLMVMSATPRPPTHFGGRRSGWVIPAWRGWWVVR
jgi:hypothetical protein